MDARVRHPALPQEYFVVGERELDAGLEASDKRIVQVLPQVARKDADSPILLPFWEQVGDFDVRVTIVGIAHLGSFSKERVGLVEEKNGVAVFCGSEGAIEILFGIANVLADNSREIEA